jgi:DNA modification methylase
LHKQHKIKRLARSLKDHGFLGALVVSKDNLLVTGSARLEAAKAAGLREVPVVRAEHLTVEQLRLFRIADNKLSEGSEWDFQALAIEFNEIAAAAPDLNQDSSGFSITERDIIYGRHRAAELADLDDDGERPKAVATARLGDVFNLGRQIVTCGDATSPEVIGLVVGDRQVRTVASDLPYNVQIAGNVSGLGETKHREFAMASGEMSKLQFIEFLTRAIAATKGHLLDGALLYLFMDWRHIDQLIAAAAANDLDYLNLLIWAKTNAGMGSFYRSAYEMVGVFKHGDAPYTNNVNLGRDGRSRSNLLSYPGVNTFTKGRKKSLALHPTVKPVALMADLILDSSAPGELILDPFGGSGTTLIAAERTDRVAALIEIDPLYVDVIVRRFEDATGETATLASTGQTFAELVEERRVGEG